MKREKLIRARVKKGLSQKVAAHLLGVSRNTWSLWELGTEDPYPINVGELCKFFGVKDPGELDLEPRQVRREHAKEPPPSPLELPPSSFDQEETPSPLARPNAQSFVAEHQRKQAVPSRFSQTSSIIGEGESSEELESKGMDEGRRQLMQDALSVTGTAIIAPASLLQQFARVLARPSMIEKEHLSILEQRTALLWQYRDDGLLLPGELYIAVSRHAHHIVHLLEGFPVPSLQMRLLSIACELFTLCGALLYDLGAHKQARDHYRLAMQAATQAEAPSLQAIASTWMSFSWTYERQYQEAVHQITQSLSFLKDPNADRSTFAWTAAVAAEIYAQLGHADECRSFLDQAEASLREPSHQPHFLSLHRFDDAQLNGFRGVCYQLLHDPKKGETVKLLEQARGALEQALLDASVSPRRKQLYRADLAKAYAIQGEIDMACHLAIQTVQEMNQATAKNVRQRLGEIQQLLQPYKETPSLKCLNEALHTVGVSST